MLPEAQVLPEAVLVIGGTGVGKSTWIRKRLLLTHAVIDSDRLLAKCPLADPQPCSINSPTYLWCRQRTIEQLEAALKSQRRRSFVCPCTGKSASDGQEHPKVAYMRRAREAGFRTRVIHLVCRVEVARTRNSTRQRQLPDELIERSRQGAQQLYEQLRGVCDMHEEHDVSAHDATYRRRNASFSGPSSKQSEKSARGNEAMDGAPCPPSAADELRQRRRRVSVSVHTSRQHSNDQGHFGPDATMTVRSKEAPPHSSPLRRAKTDSSFLSRHSVIQQMNASMNEMERDIAAAIAAVPESVDAA